MEKGATQLAAVTADVLKLTYIGLLMMSPIVHYIVVAERSYKYCAPHTWKEDISELASQIFKVPESIFGHLELSL
jgi:hypothetical protein